MTQQVHSEGKKVATAQSSPVNDHVRSPGIHSIEESPAPEIVTEVLSRPGRPLDPTTRAAMEPRFGLDFSRVRIHSDARAAESARAVGAGADPVRRHMV